MKARRGVRQLARHVAEIPLSIRAMGIWERIEQLVDDGCGFESHGQVLVAENAAEFDTCRARVAELNALGFAHEELIDGPELRRLVRTRLGPNSSVTICRRAQRSVWPISAAAP